MVWGALSASAAELVPSRERFVAGPGSARRLGRGNRRARRRRGCPFQQGGERIHIHRPGRGGHRDGRRSLWRHRDGAHGLRSVRLRRPPAACQQRGEAHGDSEGIPPPPWGRYPWRASQPRPPSTISLTRAATSLGAVTIAAWSASTSRYPQRGACARPVNAATGCGADSPARRGAQEVIRERQHAATAR